MPKPPPHGPIGHSQRSAELDARFARGERIWRSVEHAIGWALIGFALGYVLASIVNAH